MEYVGIESIKRSYRDILQSNGDYESAARINIDNFTDPIFKGFNVHPEIEPNLSDINKALQDISVDLTALNSQFGSVALLYDNLMTDILFDLENVDEIINKEKERIQDLNIIAGNINAFSAVKTLSASDLSGTCSMEDEYTFMCKATDRNSVNITVEDVSGNGFEGNTYVYNNGIYEKDVLDSSIRDKMIDDSSTSYWEYSRITMSDKQQHYPQEVNFDNEEADCTILISGEEEFNSVKIQSDITNVSVKQISVSYDNGLTYEDTMTESRDILDDSQKYENSDYIYGSGLLCFPATTHAKIRLRSNGALSDDLAFTKVILDNVTFLSDIRLNTNDYIEEYLAPLFVHIRTNNPAFINIPTSVLIGVSLVRTGIKPSNIGLFNFWDLPYSTNITSAQEDNGRCAFSDRESAAAAICNFMINDNDIPARIPRVKPLQCTEIQCINLAKLIFDVLSDDSETAMAQFNNFWSKYQLKHCDEYLAHYIENPIYSKYEQYFIRYDKQQNDYEKALETAETVIKLNTAKRHVIRINDITAFTNTFESPSYFETTELISAPVDCIAVFANEYYPPVFSGDYSVYGVSDYLTYKLKVNGVEYDIVPVNSHKAGTKIIRYSNYTVTENYTVHISEPIKSASLKVNFVTPNYSYSPYLSNLKICFGKAASL